MKKTNTVAAAFRLPRILRAALVVAGLVAGTAQATDTYMLVPGIEGDSEHRGYEKWLQLDSFAFSATTRRCKGVTAVKGLDIASPFLGAAVTNGDVFPNVTVVVTKSINEVSVPVLRFRLRNVSLVGISQIADDITQVLSEQIALKTISDIELTVFPVDAATGRPGTPVTSTISCSN